MNPIANRPDLDTPPRPTVSPSIAIPPGWRRRRTRGGPIELAALVVPPSGLAPVVRLVDAGDAGPGLAGTHQRVTDMLLAGAVMPDLEDVDVLDLAGQDVGYLRLAHKLDDREVITEAWVWAVAGSAWLVTATVDCGDYADYCDLLEDIALSFEPPELSLTGRQS